MSERLPLPWCVTKAVPALGSWGVRASNGHIVAREVDEDTARFIVHASNFHEELLEAVTLAEGALRLCIPKEAVKLIAEHEDAWHMLCHARIRLEEAKAKAEGRS